MLKLHVPQLLLKISLRASSPIWEAKRASRERTSEGPRKGELATISYNFHPPPLAASPLARAFSRDLFHSPKQESLLAGYLKIRRTLTS